MRRRLRQSSGLSRAGAEEGRTEWVGDLSGAGQLASKGNRSTRFLYGVEGRLEVDRELFPEIWDDSE